MRHSMFIQDDNTYNNLREKSFLQWLDRDA